MQMIYNYTKDLITQILSHVGHIMAFNIGHAFKGPKNPHFNACYFIYPNELQVKDVTVSRSGLYLDMFVDISHKCLTLYLNL